MLHIQYKQYKFAIAHDLSFSFNTELCFLHLCVALLTPSLFCPLLASISCRARTDSDCSSTKVQMHRSGGTYCKNRTEQNPFFYDTLLFCFIFGLD